MPHLSFTAVIPPILIALILGLSLHRWTAKPEPGPPPTTAAAREAAREATGAGQPPAQPPAGNVLAPPSG
jgi:hypothetical protein